MMKLNFRFQHYLAVTLILIVAACQVKRPDDLIPESKMEKLLYEYHIAKAMGDNLSYEENYKKALYLDAVFKKYEVTEAVFDSSLVWYARNTETFSKVYEKLGKHLKKNLDDINHIIARRERKVKAYESRDSLNVWSGLRLVRLTGMPADHLFTFSFTADTTFRDRDTLIWTANYHFLDPIPRHTRAAIMNMQIVYQNDSVVSRTERIIKSGKRRIVLFADTLGTIKEVKGFIHLSNSAQSKSVLIADGLNLIRYHCRDSLTFAQRDSINKRAALKADSLKRVHGKKPTDSLQMLHNVQRNAPENMKHRRTNIQTAKKPEQIEIEKQIEKERLEQERIQRLNQQRRYPAARRR